MRDQAPSPDLPHLEPPVTAGPGAVPAYGKPNPRTLSPQGSVCLQRRVLLTSSQGSGRCLWEKGTGVRTAPLPVPPAPGADSLLPTILLHPQHHPDPSLRLSPALWSHSRLTLMDTVFLVRMRLMTSSWVHEEMEYPLIRTISSPTLATDRGNRHRLREHRGAGQVHCQMPRACSPGKGTMA